MSSRTYALTLCVVVGVCGFAPPAVADVTVVLTADTEGHVNACRECPEGHALGGLDRRATAVRQLRGAGDILLLDAGNALFGAESIDSGGAAIVEAYNALKYDAIHLTPRDFRLGKATTLQALRRARFPVVSANLLNADDGQPLAKPFVVVSSAGTRVAVVGVSEPPAGLEYLPHWTKQLAGVRIRPVDEALAEWLPQAKAEADSVVLLYYGSAKGIQAVRDRFGGELAAICAGGVRPDQVITGDGALIISSSEHGKRLARAVVGQGRADVDHVALDDSVTPDAAMAELLAAAVVGETAPNTAAGATAEVAPVSTAEPAIDPAVTPSAESAGRRRLMQAEVKPLPVEPAREPAVEPKPDAVATEAPPAAEPAVPAVPRVGEGGTPQPKTEKTRPLVAPAPKAGESAVPSKPDPDPRTEPGATTSAEPQPKASAPKFCTNCGKKLVVGVKFCTNCGTRVAPPAKDAPVDRPVR